MNGAFGQPTYLFTIAPNDGSSIDIKVVATGSDGITREASFQQSILSRFPALSVRHYKKVIDILIEIVVGWDVKVCGSDSTVVFPSMTVLSRTVLSGLCGTVLS